MAIAFWARRRQISFVFLITLYIASLKGESDSERSSSHSNRLHNDSSIVVSVKTSTSKSTTTTVSPRTTTTIPPSTTVPTLPNPYRWSVPTGGNVCLLLESGIRMKFSYIKQKTNELVTDAIADVPVDANKTFATGYCNSTLQTIVLNFFDGWKLSLAFSRNETDNEYHMTYASLSYDIKPGHAPFPNALAYANKSEQRLGEEMFRTDVGRSFVCTSQQTFLEGNTSRVGLISVNFYDTQVEAFRVNATNTEFSPVGGRCTEDEMNMLVPIVVGACLAGLIIIVLITYFIGRQQSKRGYENV